MAQIKVNIDLKPEEYERFLIFKELITSNYVIGNFKHQFSDTTKQLVSEKYESVLGVLLLEYSKYKKPINVSSLTKSKEYQFGDKDFQFNMAIVERNNISNE